MVGHLTLGRAVDLFLGAKAAEGARPRRSLVPDDPLRAVARVRRRSPDRSPAGPDLRAWLLELRTTLAPISVAGYVRTLKVFGNWLQAEELAEASALRALRKPRVPDKLIEPVPDDTLRRLLGLASVRDRAILLLLLDTGTLDRGDLPPHLVREGGAVPPPDMEPVVGLQEPAVVPDLDLALVALRVDHEYASGCDDDVVDIPLGARDTSVVQHGGVLRGLDRPDDRAVAVDVRGGRRPVGVGPVGVVALLASVRPGNRRLVEAGPPSPLSRWPR